MSNNTTDAAKKKRKVGSGRTAGSYSFVVVTLKDIQGKFADPNQKITVGRKWAELCGFDIAVTTSAKDIAGRIDGTTPNTQVTAKVTELD